MPVFTRDDNAIDFDWGNNSPDAKVPSDNFSVRWTRTLAFTAGTYRFYASCDDGVRIFVDGSRVVDAWRDQSLPNTRSGDIYLSSGNHKITVEYYEHGGGASAHIWWDIPQAFTGWKGSYYDNTQLRGGPVLIRDDAVIDFNWGDGAPASYLPTDNFSVRWVRTIEFPAGNYRFNVQSDDGIRIWVDNVLVMDYWQNQDNVWRYLERIYLSGQKTIKVEYFERAGFARIRFWWESADVVPFSTPSPTSVPVSGILSGPWTGEYFNNINLAGNPILVRTDSVIDFNWKWDAPATGINRDYFSVRWTGTFSFIEGQYRFVSLTDDGVRVYVDDHLVINAWRPMRGTRTGLISLAPGQHSVRVEYFERSQAAMARVTADLVGAAQNIPLPTPRPQQVVCTEGPLRLEAWSVGETCIPGGGWQANIFVNGIGGDCRYTYLWEGQLKGQSKPGSMTFYVNWASRGAAIVGTATVQSAGQTVTKGVYVSPPKCP